MEIVPEKDPKLAAGFLEAGEGVATCSTKGAAGAATDLVLLHMLTNIALTCVGMQRDLGAVQDKQQLALLIKYSYEDGLVTPVLVISPLAKDLAYGLLTQLPHQPGKHRLALHNNLGESDIREYAKRRKISGSTRSDPGRRCRDTFRSLKKTCRKHGISSWEYFKDRVSGNNVIPPLTEYIRQAAYSRI